MCEVEKEAQGLLIVEKMRAKEGWYETSTFYSHSVQYRLRSLY